MASSLSRMKTRAGSERGKVLRTAWTDECSEQTGFPREAEIESPPAERSCYPVALALLARRDHSHLELRDKLTFRGFSSDEIQVALERLAAEGALSEKRFTEEYARHRVARGFGPLKIENELRERGIAPSLARLVLDEYADGWLEAARAVLSRHFRDSSGGFEARATQHRYLERRGFTAGIIRDALRKD